MKYYRVQKRAMSPDIIEKNIGTEMNPKWKAYICPIGNRFDNVSEELCEYLNFSGLHEPKP